ncbi:hypothetical protein Tco_0989291 [Tanacetum coccineum]|uniref:Uncharacterized protein n=1 Tax=Tanacetum coccineum TaxID=301880 RepID=A0ABQ5EUQ6_9ASTR
MDVWWWSDDGSRWSAIVDCRWPPLTTTVDRWLRRYEPIIGLEEDAFRGKRGTHRLAQKGINSLAAAALLGTDPGAVIANDWHLNMVVGRQKVKNTPQLGWAIYTSSICRKKDVRCRNYFHIVVGLD